jgi:hypothetical protein
MNKNGPHKANSQDMNLQKEYVKLIQIKILILDMIAHIHIKNKKYIYKSHMMVNKLTERYYFLF